MGRSDHFQGSIVLSICTLNNGTRELYDDMKYAEKIKTEQARINELNKQHARLMERRVAKKLRGVRVPMSGSGSLKGDGIAQSAAGSYVIECKYRSTLDSKKNPIIHVHFDWLDRLQRDVEAMNFSFGVLVVSHSKMRTKDIVCIDAPYWAKIAPPDLPAHSIPAFQLIGITFKLSDDYLPNFLTTEYQGHLFGAARTTHHRADRLHPILMEMETFIWVLEQRAAELPSLSSRL
jgi:hypothetical protein